MKAHGGEEVHLLLILDLGTRWGEWSASRPGRALAPGKNPPVPIGQEAGWAPKPVWTQAGGKVLSPLPGIEPRSPGRAVRSQTLHCLSYPAPRNIGTTKKCVEEQDCKIRIKQGRRMCIWRPRRNYSPGPPPAINFQKKNELYS
jgi:hypothetical protein